MRRAVPAAAAACLLLGPTVLAFFSGAYFSQPRLVAALVAWALVIALTVIGPAPLPRSAPGRLALGGLVLLTAWTALSVTWAPLRGPAIESVERLLLYAGALLVAIGVLRDARVVRAVEPALAAGATIVIAYGLSGRLLPGVVHLSASRSAAGRLEQPITYWNAEGTLAAIGLVLCARVAGDRSRPAWMRGSAAAAVAPLAGGVYLSYSRGAIAVAVLGLVVLVAAAPTRSQLRAAAVALATGIAATITVGILPGVASLHGTPSAIRRDGAIALVLVTLTAVVAGGWTAHRARRAGEHEQPPSRSRRLVPAAALALAVVTLGLVLGGLGEKPSAAELGARPARLATASSNRYEYWRIGARAFAHHPLAGLGAGGFRVYWLRERTITETVRDVHSIEIEVAAEMGLVGLLALALMIAGVAAAAGRALRRDRATAAGACAATLAWLLHASIDWDWQLPAVTLPAIALTGALVVLAEAPPLPLSDAAR